MPSQTIRVLHPHDPRGSVIWSALFGTALSATPTICADQAVGRLLSMLVTGLSACICIPFALSWVGPLIAALMGWWFAGRCQHRCLVFKVGFAFGAGYILGWFGAHMLFKPFAIVPYQLPLAIGVMVLIPVVVGLVFGAANLAINAIFRQTRYVIAEQDGTLCWKCAYVVGNPLISDRCSECGEPIHPPIKPMGPYWVVRVAKRSAPIVLAAVVAFFVLIIGPRMLRQSTANAKLAKGLGSTAETVNCAMVPTAGSNRGWEAMGVMIDVPADPTKKILVAYAPNPAVGQPVMQVQLMGVMSGSGGSVPCYGNPWIPFTLSTAQSERVLAQGLPPSLIDELLKTANTNKWTLMPAGGAVGHVELDPDKHFATDTGP